MLDAFFSFLIDVVFYLIGKSAWLFLRFLRIPICEFSHWGYVTFGFLVLVALVVIGFFLVILTGGCCA